MFCFRLCDSHGEKNIQAVVRKHADARRAKLQQLCELALSVAQRINQTTLPPQDRLAQEHLASDALTVELKDKTNAAPIHDLGVS